MISSIRLDLLQVLGDDYISQHVKQAYRDYIERTSYKMYMSNMVTELLVMNGYQVEKTWNDMYRELDDATTPETQTETEHEIKTRLLAKLNGREGE